LITQQLFSFSFPFSFLSHLYHYLPFLFYFFNFALDTFPAL
jgi:hypothetical protein